MIYSAMGIIRSVALLLVGISLTWAHLAAAEPKFRIDTLPMYGQPKIERPASLKKADAAFIKKAVKKFGGDRQAASAAWCDVAQGYLNKLDLDNAMRRYNQGWLLDPESYLPFWGFGRVALQKDQFQEAIQHFEEALRRDADPYQKPALLSDTATAYSLKASYAPHLNADDKAAAIAKANEYFAQCTTLAPDYANGWTRWAMSLHREGKYAASWEKLHKAQKTGAKNISPEFLSALVQSMPEPK